MSSSGVSRAFFESVTLGAFAVMVALGVLFWATGAIGRRRGLTGEATAAGAGSTPASSAP